MDALEQWKAEVTEEAKRMALAIGKCPLCSSTNLIGEWGDGLCKIKPMVSCGDCGELLSFG
jgi:hypothetical protein